MGRGGVEYILAEAEEPFFSKSDDEKAPVGFWRGEFWGKWIIGAVRACKYQKNEKLEAIIRESIDKIIKTADENGYIGTYRDATRGMPCDKEEARRTVGFPCDFCWNIWCQKYTVWALIEAYGLFGDEGILTAAKKLADQLIDNVHGLGVSPCETGTFFGVASGSIMKPMLLLYGYTHDKKLLDFAVEIADGFEDDKAKCIKIIKNSLLERPIHIWNYDNPRAEGQERFTSQKAYEMMSCFEGICKLYRVTGCEKYLKATEKFFELLIKYEYNRLLCVGFNDRFLFAASVEDAVSEACDIIHFMRLCHELYKITGNIKYIDYYEDAFLNPFLASVTADGSYGARGVRSMSHHIIERDVVNMKYNHCCVNNIPRAFENAAETALCQNDDGIFVNMYIPSSACFDRGGLTVLDGYVRSCKTDIVYSLKKDTAIYLRVPGWSKKTTVTHGNKTFNAACGEYFKVFVKSGEGKINIEFDSTPKVMDAKNYDRNLHPITPYLKARYDLDMPAECVKTNKATVKVGAVLLAMSTRLGTEWKEMSSDITVDGRFTSCKAEPFEAHDTLAAYNVIFETDTGRKIIPMCDYVSASNRFISEDFSIFV